MPILSIRTEGAIDNECEQQFYRRCFPSDGATRFCWFPCLSGVFLTRYLFNKRYPRGKSRRAILGHPNDADSIGLAEQLAKGVGVFAGLYIIEEPDTAPLLVTDVKISDQI